MWHSSFFHHYHRLCYLEVPISILEWSFFLEVEEVSVQEVVVRLNPDSISVEDKLIGFWNSFSDNDIEIIRSLTLLFRLLIDFCKIFTAEFSFGASGFVWISSELIELISPCLSNFSLEALEKSTAFPTI